jgi:branched-chain amino acid transport system ATP-binding protein
MAGLNPREIEDLMSLILEVNAKGITILVIEHVMKAIMGISTRIMALDQGRQIALGSAKEVAENEEVIKCYLGERFARRMAERQ